MIKNINYKNCLEEETCNLNKVYRYFNNCNFNDVIQVDTYFLKYI